MVATHISAAVVAAPPLDPALPLVPEVPLDPVSPLDPLLVSSPEDPELPLVPDRRAPVPSVLGSSLHDRQVKLDKLASATTVTQFDMEERVARA